MDIFHFKKAILEAKLFNYRETIGVNESRELRNLLKIQIHETTPRDSDLIEFGAELGAFILKKSSMVTGGHMVRL